MRRKDREVQSLDEIFGILNRCNTVRIGFQGDKYPYVVPVSFGAELVDGQVIVYFHCARQGMKLELLKANPRVCVVGKMSFISFLFPVPSTPPGSARGRVFPGGRSWTG